MAIKTWYGDSKSFGGATTYFFFTGDQGALSGGSNYSNTGWNVGQNAANNYALLDNGSEVSRNSFSAGIRPSSTATFVETGQTIYGNAYNDNTVVVIPQSGINLVYPYNAVFSAGTWTFSFDVQADNTARGQDGRMHMKLWKSVFNSNGTWSQTQISDSTNGTNWIVSNTVTNLSTTVSQTCTMTLTTSAPLMLSGEKTNSTAATGGYLTVELQWQVTGAASGGGSNNADVVIMHGTGTNTTITSPQYRRRVSVL